MIALELWAALIVCCASFHLVASELEPTKIYDVISVYLEELGEVRYPPSALEFLENKLDTEPADKVEIIKHFLELRKTNCSPENVNRFKILMHGTRISINGHDENDVFKSIVGYYAKELDKSCFNSLYSKYGKGIKEKNISVEQLAKIEKLASGIMSSRVDSYYVLGGSFELQKHFDKLITQLGSLGSRRDVLHIFDLICPSIKIKYKNFLKVGKGSEERIAKSAFEKSFNKNIVEECKLYFGAVGGLFDGLTDFMVSIPGDRRFMEYNWPTMIDDWAGSLICEQIISKPQDELLEKVYNFYLERYEK